MIMFRPVQLTILPCIQCVLVTAENMTQGYFHPEGCLLTGRVTLCHTVASLLSRRLYCLLHDPQICVRLLASPAHVWSGKTVYAVNHLAPRTSAIITSCLVYDLRLPVSKGLSGAGQHTGKLQYTMRPTRLCPTLYFFPWCVTNSILADDLLNLHPPDQLSFGSLPVSYCPSQP